jgi:hypothetical protein
MKPDSEDLTESAGLALQRQSGSAEDVREARLKRRIARLQMQRDHWKKEHAKLHEFLESFPFYRREREKLDAARARELGQRELVQRCKEQAALIEMLQAAATEKTA